MALPRLRTFTRRRVASFRARCASQIEGPVIHADALKILTPAKGASCAAVRLTMKMQNGKAWNRAEKRKPCETQGQITWRNATVLLYFCYLPNPAERRHKSNISIQSTEAFEDPSLGASCARCTLCTEVAAPQSEHITLGKCDCSMEPGHLAQIDAQWNMEW